MVLSSSSFSDFQNFFFSAGEVLEGIRESHQVLESHGPGSEGSLQGDRFGCGRPMHIPHQVNQAQKQRDQTSYMSSPCHIELPLSEKEEPAKKEPDIQLAPRKIKKSTQALHSGASS